VAYENTHLSSSLGILAFICAKSQSTLARGTLARGEDLHRKGVALYVTSMWQRLAQLAKKDFVTTGRLPWLRLQK
jgi:hypothetical protein